MHHMATTYPLSLYCCNGWNLNILDIFRYVRLGINNGRKYVSICSGCPKMSPLGTLPSAKCLWERDRIWLGGDLATDGEAHPRSNHGTSWEVMQFMSCNSCLKAKSRDTGKSNKACRCTTKLRVAKSCRWNVQIWANISISNAWLHFIPQVCAVAACWMTQPGYWLMLSRESLALIGWLVAWSRKSVTPIITQISVASPSHAKC